MSNRIKLLNFNDSIITTENPTLSVVNVADAVNDDEAASLGQLKEYTESLTGTVVDDIAELTAINSSTLNDEDMRYVDANGSWYQYDAASAVADDGLEILQPDDTPANGRWERSDKVDKTNDQTIASGVKIFNEFPKKSGSGAALNPTSDAELITKFYGDNTFATAVAQEAGATGINALEKTVTELAINQEYGEFQGENGLYVEQFIDHDNEDRTIETNSISLAQINGLMREAPFNEPIHNWFQKDRESSLVSKKGGIAQATYKPFYGEIVNSWDMKKYGLNANNLIGISWDATRRWWWLVDNATNIVAVSEDFSQAQGWWIVDNQSIMYMCYVDGNNLYISDYDYPGAGNGRITKHTISADGSAVDGLASGNILPDTTSLMGDATYKNPAGITDDGTDLYVVCFGTGIIGKITKSTFAAWDSNFDITDFGGTGARGLIYNGTDLFVKDGAEDFIRKIKKDGTVGYNSFPAILSGITGLAYKDGDIYGCDSSSDKVIKYAIKNTRILEGQIIGSIPNPLANVSGDITFVENLLDGGTADGYLTVDRTLKLQVWDTSWVERTSGTPRTTILGIGDGSGVNDFTGIDSDGTDIYLTGDGSSNDVLYKFAIVELDGTFSLAIGDRLATFGAGDGLRGCAYNTDKDIIAVEVGSGTFIQLISGGGAVLTKFEIPKYITDAGSTQINLVFNPNNNNELYIKSINHKVPIDVIDFEMSRYMGDGNQPYVIKRASQNISQSGCGFNANNDLLSFGEGSDNIIYTHAIASADDKAVTGERQRNVRYYSTANSTLQKTYPSCGKNSRAIRQNVRYRRKYAASMYSELSNALPLDGDYIVGPAGFTIIDLESNTEFLKWEMPSIANNINILDTSSQGQQLNEISVVDDKVFIAVWSGTAGNILVVDFLNDTAYIIFTGSSYKWQLTLKDANQMLPSASFATLWGTNISTVLGTGNANNQVNSIDARQVTINIPDEHQGNLTTLDNGNIYFLAGTTSGYSLTNWSAGISFTGPPSVKYKVRIAEDFSIIDSYVENSSGHVRQYGDCRKINANHGTIPFGIQTGFEIIVNAALSNRFINDIDVKTIWENGIATNYVVVGSGAVGVSDVRAVDVINLNNGTVETVVNSSADPAGMVGVAWGKGNEIYAAYNSSGGGTALLNIYKRLDYIWGNSSFWVQSGIDSTIGSYVPLNDDILGVDFHHNTICLSSDLGVQLIELPKGDSRFETNTFAFAQMERMFYLANDSKGAATPSGKIQKRNIFSDINDAKFIFTDGNTKTWSAVVTSNNVFGGNYRTIEGNDGVTEGKIEWPCEANCTGFNFHLYRDVPYGKVDIKVHDGTSNVVDFVLDMYSVEALPHDFIPIRGLDPSKTHTVTLTATNQQHAGSSGYWLIFAGCVEIFEDTQDRAAPTIQYLLSNDQDKATKHFHPMATEGENQDIFTAFQMFTGTGAQTVFQFPSSNLAAEITKVEVFDGTWQEKTEVTDWSHDTPGSGEISITFVAPPPSAADNIRISFIQQGELGKIRTLFNYPAGSSGIEEAYINDFGVYTRELPIT